MKLVALSASTVPKNHAFQTQKRIAVPVIQLIRFSGNPLKLDSSTISHLADYDNSDKPSYITALQDIPNKELRNQISNMANNLRRGVNMMWMIELDFIIGLFIVTLPYPFIKMAIAKSSMRKGLDQLKSLPNDELRIAFINKLIYSYRKPGTKLGFKAVPSIQNPITRDSYIEKACNHESASIRVMGAKMLPLVSDPKKQQELAKRLELDPSSRVRLRVNMIAGRHPLLQTLMGWYFTPNMSAELKQKTVEALLESDEDESLSLPKADTQSPYQAEIQAIKSLAQQMADRLKTYFKESPQVREQLVAQFGSEQLLPSANRIQNQFYQSALNYLRSKQGRFKKMFHINPPEKDVLEMSLLLMRAANQTDGMLMTEFKPKQVEILLELEKQQKTLETDLKQAQLVLTQQVLFQEQVDREIEKLTREVNDPTTVAAVEASKGTFPQISKEQQERHQALKERQMVMKRAVLQAQTKVDNLRHQQQQYQQKLVAALQYGMLGASREELESVLQRQDKPVKNQMTIEKLLDMAEEEKYMVLAEEDKPQAVKKAEATR